MHVFIGAAIIVAAGIYIFVREQVRAREKARAFSTALDTATKD